MKKIFFIAAAAILVLNVKQNYAQSEEGETPETNVNVVAGERIDTYYIPRIQSVSTEEVVIENSFIFNNSKGVGIGTAIPSYFLDVTKGISDNWLGNFYNESNNAQISFAHGEGYGALINAGSNASENTYALKVAKQGFEDNPFLVVRGDGKVGIGTSSINADLHITGKLDTPTRLRLTSLESNGTKGVTTNWDIEATQDDLYFKQSNFLMIRFISGGQIEAAGKIKAAKFTAKNGTQEVNIATGTNTSGYKLDLGVNDDGVNFENDSYIRGFNFKNMNGVLMNINSDGGLSIGTNQNKASLHIHRNADDALNFNAKIRLEDFVDDQCSIDGNNVLQLENYGAEGPTLIIKGGLNPVNDDDLVKYATIGCQGIWTYRTISAGDGISAKNETTDFLFQVNNNALTFGNYNEINFKVEKNGLTRINNKLICTEIHITQNVWADYVFNESYVLRPLNEVENFIEENKHLPDVPSVQEVKENGLNLGDMNATLLQKIEELTLYVIELKKENESMKRQIEMLK